MYSRAFSSSERHSHASTMPSAVAKSANKPSATKWLAEEEDELGFDPLVLEELAEVGTGVPVATAPTPAVTGPLSEVACSFELFAEATNASNVFPLVGALIAPTIPRRQWPVVLQKNQMGSLSLVIRIVNCFSFCRPESKPVPLVPFKYTQGLWKELCVTE